MYKFSNYNIVVEHNEDVLLYNTLSGVESVCKMPRKYKDCFQRALIATILMMNK